MAPCSWSMTQRLFFMAAFTIMSVHFTIIYVFIQEHLASHGSGSGSLVHAGNGPPVYDTGNFQDERSPLEKDAANTDWGMDFRDPKLLHRHLVVHRGDAAGSVRRRLNVAGHDAGIIYSDRPRAPTVDTRPARSRIAPDSDLVLGVGPDGTGNNGISDACLGLQLLQEDFDEPLEWQDVVPGLAAVFSAYLDTSPGAPAPDRLVVVGVAGPGVLRRMVFECQLWYRHPGDTVHSWVVTATAVWLQKGGENTGGDVFFYCPANPKRDPLAVSIINRKQCAHSPPNLLLIRNIDEAQARTRPINNFTVCIRPLRNRFNDASALVETVELNFLLGASQIAFYDEDTTNIVKNFYNSYKHEDTAKIIPWKPPSVKLKPDRQSKSNDSNLCELSALNDCLYRFRFSSKYVVFVDIEEFILPEVSTTWNDLMLKINHKPGISVFRFRRVLFEFPANNLGQDFRLLSQLKKHRLGTLPLTVSPRYMVAPAYVDIVGFDDVILRRKGETVEVSEKDAGVHDYNDHHHHQGFNSATGVEDKRAEIYHDALLWRVMKRKALVTGKE